MSRVFVREQDVLRVISIASTTLTLSIHADVRTSGGRIVPINFSQTPNTDRTALGTDTPAIGVSGEIVSATVQNRATGIKRGQCYVTLNIRGGETYQGLCKGYVYDGHQVDLGQYVEPGPGGGEGAIRVLTEADPAAETQLAAQTVPTNAIWKLRGFSATLVTSADAGNRFVEVQYRNAADAVIARAAAGNIHTASLTIPYSGGLNGGHNRVNENAPTNLSISQFELPDIPLPEDFDFIVNVVNFDAVVAGDNWGAPQYAIEEWLVI